MSDLSAAAVAIGGTLVGGAFTLWATALQRTGDRELRAEDRVASERATIDAEIRHRAREAAEQALATLETLRRSFQNARKHRSDPENPGLVAQSADALRQQAIFLPDAVRGHLIDAASVFDNYSLVEEWTGASPATIAWETYTGTVAALRQFLLSERVALQGSTVRTYVGAIDEAFAQMEQSQREWENEQRQKQEQDRREADPGC